VIGLAALALFGAGLGLFIAPNNHATIDSAPPSSPGRPGPCSPDARIGHQPRRRGATSMLSWRIAALSGTDDRGLTFAGRPLLDAIVESLLMLAVFAAIAGAVSLVRVKQHEEHSRAL